MIVILRKEATKDQIRALEGVVQAAGLRSEFSPGEDGSIVLVVGETRGSTLEATLAAHPAAERVVPILPQRRYERLLSRRSFLDVFIAVVAGLLAIVAAAVASLFLSRSGEERRKSNLVKAGSVADYDQRPSRLVDHEGRPILVFRSATGEFHALSAICTHSEVCTVQWNADRQEIACPCHRAAFDVFGNVRHGPPPRPLPVVPVEVIGDSVFLKA